MTIDHQVLNPALYQRLELYFGDVDVVSGGCAMDWTVRWQPPPVGVVGEGRTPRRQIHFAGEEYRVRCRRCNDHCARLHINHRWGVWDEETQTRNLWLANCFNEGCYSEYEARRDLFERIWKLSMAQMLASRGQTTRDIRRGVKSDRPRDELGEIPNPGPLLRLDELAIQYPNHEALSYLAGRGFDPVFLGKFWKVSYCPTSRYRWASNRIIVPIVQQGMQVGWQARYVGVSVNGESFNAAGVPKYWTSPQMPRRLVAYNIERALTHPTLVIVEGTTDVWNVGPMATALLGVSASADVLTMIAAGMKRHRDGGVVVVMLDPQQPRRQNPRPAPHPISSLVGKLSRVLPAERIVPVWLPEQYDPGNMDRSLIYKLIREQAQKQNLSVHFDRPKPIPAVTALPEDIRC